MSGLSFEQQMILDENPVRLAELARAEKRDPSTIRRWCSRGLFNKSRTERVILASVLLEDGLATSREALRRFREKRQG